MWQQHEAQEEEEDEVPNNKCVKCKVCVYLMFVCVFLSVCVPAPFAIFVAAACFVTQIIKLKINT